MAIFRKWHKSAMQEHSERHRYSLEVYDSSRRLIGTFIDWSIRHSCVYRRRGLTGNAHCEFGQELTRAEYRDPWRHNNPVWVTVTRRLFAI